MPFCSANTLNHHTIPSTPKVSKIGSGRGHQSEPKFFARPRCRLRRRQSFGDALDRGLVANGRVVDDQVCYHRSTLERLPVRSYYPGPSYSFNPLDDQQRGAASSRTGEHRGKKCYNSAWWFIKSGAFWYVAKTIERLTHVSVGCLCAVGFKRVCNSKIHQLLLEGVFQLWPDYVIMYLGSLATWP